MENFGFINGEFINLYSDENPILDVDDTCFFMFTNLSDYHRPMLAKGIIFTDKFTDGLNKEYYIKATEILETPNIINTFVHGKQFEVITSKPTSIRNKKNIVYYNEETFNENLLRIEGFFVRDTFEKINKLRQEYIQIIRNDLTKQLQELNSI